MTQGLSWQLGNPTLSGSYIYIPYGCFPLWIKSIMVFYSQNKKFLGLSHRNKDQMLWLKHYAKANSLVVFFKGRLTVLQINGSRPSLQLAVFHKKKKLGEQTWISQYVRVSLKQLYIWTVSRVSAWLRRLQIESFQGADQVTTSTRSRLRGAVLLRRVAHLHLQSSSLPCSELAAAGAGAEPQQAPGSAGRTGQPHRVSPTFGRFFTQ